MWFLFKRNVQWRAVTDDYFFLDTGKLQKRILIKLNQDIVTALVQRTDVLLCNLVTVNNLHGKSD